MKYVPLRVSRFIGAQKLYIHHNSPTILLAAGITGVVGSAVLASRATLKAQPIWEATHLELDKAGYDVEKKFREDGIRVPDSEQRKQRVAIYATTAAQLTKLYAPAVVLGSLSIAALVQSHKILNDRYNGLAAAYISLQEGFEAYRKRIRGEVGEERERELYYDVQEIDAIEMGPNGPKKVKVKQFGSEGGSPYARLFNRENPNWKDTPEYNIMFLRQVEAHVNRILRSQGYMFLNRVYEELGMDATEQGATTGWLYERGTGDNVIDFGIWEDNMKERVWDFMVGNEDEIFLDFNVDGPIHKKLHLPKLLNH